MLLPQERQPAINLIGVFSVWVWRFRLTVLIDWSLRGLVLTVHWVLLSLKLELVNGFLIGLHQVVLFLQNWPEACVLFLQHFHAPLHFFVPFSLLLLNLLFKFLATISNFLLSLLFLPHHLDFLQYLVHLSSQLCDHGVFVKKLLALFVQLILEILNLSD